MEKHCHCGDAVIKSKTVMSGASLILFINILLIHFFMVKDWDIPAFRDVQNETGWRFGSQSIVTRPKPDRTNCIQSSLQVLLIHHSSFSVCSGLSPEKPGLDRIRLDIYKS